MMGSKYTGLEQRKIRNKIADTRHKMKYHRERYQELESDFFRLNNSIDNKYKVKNYTV